MQPSEPAPQVIVRGSASGFAQQVSAGALDFVADEPVALGGTGLGPSPYELLLAALGSCTAMTIGSYARRKGWPLADVAVALRHERVHEADCEECGDPRRFLDRIHVAITLSGPLSDEQRARLLAIAEKCPVHKTLTSKIDIRSSSSAPEANKQS